MSSLNGKVAIVTGASKGIGAATAKALGAAGAAVVVNYASSREGAERVVAAIEAGGGRAVAVQGDVAKTADVRGLFEAAKTTFGGVDILVNNAGVFEFEPLEAVTEAAFHRQFDTNVLGVVLATQEAARHFGPTGGSIVNISSVASFNPQPNSGGLCRHQSGRRLDHAVNGSRARPPPHPRQFDRAGRRRHRRATAHRHRW